MTTVEDDRSTARLGMLEHPVEPRVREIAPAFAHLNALGLPAPRDGARNAIATALVHRSYLYESRGTLPGVTQTSLDALGRLGGAFLWKTAAVERYRTVANRTSGTMSKDVARIVATFPAWTARQEWLRKSAALSVGLDRNALPPKVTTALCQQLLGVLCLEGEEEVARRLLAGHLATQQREIASSINDPKSALYEVVGHAALSWEYERGGPDHASVFRAVVTDTRRRAGEGSGSNKKAATKQAAVDFLRRHAPEVLTARTTAVPPSPPAREIPASRAHVDTVRRLETLFSLPETSRPLLSQALVHASWAYENGHLMERCRQQDYQVLAFLGAQVLGYEHLLAIARRIVVAPPAEFAFITLPNDVFNTAFHEAGLASGLLLGAGQRSHGIPLEIGADAFQAVIGAVSEAGGFQGSLADRWPDEWAAVWQLVAPSAPRPVEPTTRLGRTASVMKLPVTYEHTVTGPAHLQRFTTVAVLHSEALGVTLTAQGAAVAGKVPAKHSASLTVLGVLERLADGSPARSFDGAKEGDRSLARFLLAQQAYVLDAAPVPIQRWIDARLFGLHLASGPRALLKWAVGVDELLGLGLPLQPGSHLRDAFRKAVEKPAIPDPLNTVLARAIDTLERIETPENITTAHVRHLMQLCDVYRCLGSDDPDILLPDLADDWRILHRGQLKPLPAFPSVRISGRTRAVLDAALSTLASDGGEASVEVFAERPLRLGFRSTQPPSPSVLEEVCSLWSTAGKAITVEAAEQGIDVIVAMAEAPARPGPIAQAVLAALQPSPEPYRAAVADLLHDLKNQLVAARLANSQPAESRTARLQQQLAASRHLDEAHTLALRLRAATSMLTSADTESVELGAFLRHYAGAVLTRLPANISLSIPTAKSTVHVALGARALTAILDNLVGNAIEALRNGGAITLDWTADDYEAAVEISDDGPGLPSDIAAALNSGKRIRSTKRGGNGLGLLGVRSLLAKVGGQLSLIATPSGTAWLTTLPLASSTPPESA
ncbi:ATP-binding protein [Streptomyces sp. NPDC046909]|uniref:ATP-binding protein n=1 Tax=Streptomyces sp. NPDC046909 TaxID=3155617 RepID=UPI0033FB1C21